jgi:hypothetical protein
VLATLGNCGPDVVLTVDAGTITQIQLSGLS